MTGSSNRSTTGRQAQSSSRREAKGTNLLRKLFPMRMQFL